MSRHYNNLLEEFDVEEIHQFRLNVKKLNAFLHLLNAGRTTTKKINLPKNLHAFYSAVGELRNLQLHGEHVQRLSKQLNLATPINYLQVLVQRQNEIKSDIRTLALQRSLHTSCYKLIASAPEKVTTQAIENFVSESKRRLMKILLAESYTDESLHCLRKILKDFLYLWSWLDTETTSLPNSAGMDKGVCIVLSERLGDFQNFCIMLQFFDRFLSNRHPTTVEVIVLSALRQHVQGEKKGLKIKLSVEMQDCVQKKLDNDVLPPNYQYQ